MPPRCAHAQEQHELQNCPSLRGQQLAASLPDMRSHPTCWNFTDQPPSTRNLAAR